MTWLQADADAEGRYRALDTLPVSAAAIPSLLSALHDDSWRVRRLAADRLGALEATPATVAQLVEMLGQRDDTGARNAAAAVLAQLGPAVLPAIIELLGHPDPDQRKFAADILGALRLPDAVAPLVWALQDADPNVRTAAAEALGHVGGPDARRALEKLLSSRDVLLRVCALEGLSELRLPVPLPMLVPLLSDPLTRRSAWRLLGHVHHPTASMLTVRALALRESRDAALVSIGASGTPLSSETEAELKIALRPVIDFIPWLEAGLASGDEEKHLGALLVARAAADPRLALAVAGSVRGSSDGEVALQTLLRLGLDGARALLSSIEALADLAAEARAVAADAIVRLAEPPLCDQLIALMDSGDPELAELGARALGRTRARQAIAPLVRSFDDDTLAMHAWRSLVQIAQTWPDEVRAALTPLVGGKLRPHAVRAWGEIMGPLASEVIKRALHDPQETVRAAAVEASLFSPKDSVSVLQAALMDESALVRRAATRTVGKLAPAQGQPLLARALRDADPTVLALACAAAGELGHRETIARLEELSRHVDPAVVLAALEGLALMSRLSDELLLRAAGHGDAEVIKLAFTLGADRPLLLDKAVASLQHARWDVRVSAGRLLAVSAGRESLSALQDAVARETTDGVAHELLSEAVETLLRRV
ncbi:MAG: HEAT repeat domain-containing protein [Archangium sp.]|nr:HEAT repeat domain-containing protein [Archangium sp.]MDP3156406.1 HEAT repeat domain-containing protein [Archangium sp.]MDP3573148.1 HEAT repeat domain-containing protein [Archangium sp.]